MTAKIERLIAVTPKNDFGRYVAWVRVVDSMLRRDPDRDRIAKVLDGVLEIMNTEDVMDTDTSVLVERVMGNLK